MSLTGALTRVPLAPPFWNLDGGVFSVGSFTGGAAGFVAASSQYLRIVDNASLSTGNVDWLGAEWVVLNSKAALRTFACRFDDNTHREYATYYDPNVDGVQPADRFRFQLYSAAGAVIGMVSGGSLSPVVGQWYLLVYYFDAVNARLGLSVNQGPFTTAATTGVPGDTTAAMIIGGLAAGSTLYHDGQIANVVFCKSPVGGIAAKAGQIRDALGRFGASVDLSTIDAATKTSWGAVSAWPLNEGLGSIRADVWGSNHLMPINAPTRAVGPGLPGHSLYFSTFNHATPMPGTPAHVDLFLSPDGVTYVTPPGVTNPIFLPPSTGGAGSSSNTLASSLMYRGGKYYLAYEFNVFSGVNDRIGVARADNIGGPYTWLTDVVVMPNTGSGACAWNPRWFIDDDNSVHLLVNAQNTTMNISQDIQPRMLDALDETMTSWSAVTTIVGTFPANMIDCILMAKSKTPNGKYAIWFKDETTKYIGYMDSTSLKTGYTVIQSGNWAGVGQAEGQMLLYIDGRWRWYLDRYLASTGLCYVDSFDNWATWTSPVNLVTPINEGTGSFIVGVDF